MLMEMMEKSELKKSDTYQFFIESKIECCEICFKAVWCIIKKYKRKNDY